MSSEEREMTYKERRAWFVYEGARVHAIALRCPVISNYWEDRSPEFKEYFVNLVSGLCLGKKGKGFEEIHDSWRKKYLNMGWVPGEKYSPEKKTHPDLVPYQDLNLKEKVKDEVFLKLVEIAKTCIWEDKNE